VKQRSKRRALEPLSYIVVAGALFVRRFHQANNLGLKVPCEFQNPTNKLKEIAEKVPFSCTGKLKFKDVI